MAEAIIGPPGTGKTTALTEITNSLTLQGINPLVCSLTKTAAQEVAGRDNLNLPAKYVGTLHSHAFHALGGHMTMAESRAAEWSEFCPQYELKADRDPDDPYNTPRDQLGEGSKLLVEMQTLRAQCVPRETWRTAVQAFANKWDEFKKDIDAYDFTDLIDRAAMYSEVPHGAGAIMVDEAQDMSRLELNLLKKWAKQAGRLTIVGDPWQALYAWRGAHPEMFSSEKLRTRRILEQSYRVPQKAHSAAMRWMKSYLNTYEPLSYKPTDEPGRVILEHFTCRSAATLVAPMVEDRLRQGMSVMIMASSSYFLGPSIAGLRDAGIPFGNPWRTKRGDWNPLAMRGKSPTARAMVDFAKLWTGGEDDFKFGALGGVPSPWNMRELSRWTDAVQATRSLRRGAKKTIDALSENDPKRVPPSADLAEWLSQDALELAAAATEGRVSLGDGLKWFRKAIKSSRANVMGYLLRLVDAGGLGRVLERPRCYVGTVHSFKGAEADCVIIYPDLTPAAFREWHDADGKDNVVKVFYVALTRARKEVIIAAPRHRMYAPIGELAN